MHFQLTNEAGKRLLLEFPGVPGNYRLQLGHKLVPPPPEAASSRNAYLGSCSHVGVLPYVVELWKYDPRVDIFVAVKRRYNQLALSGKGRDLYQELLASSHVVRNWAVPHQRRELSRAEFECFQQRFLPMALDTHDLECAVLQMSGVNREFARAKLWVRKTEGSYLATYEPDEERPAINDSVLPFMRDRLGAELYVKEV